MKRRHFLGAFSAGALGLPFFKELQAAGKKINTVKPIEGTWLGFQHPNALSGKHWNSTLENFSSQQWDEKVKEIADTGIRYIVLLNVAVHNKSFYPSKLLPQQKLGCEDPLETVLTAADKYGIRFFVSNDFFGDWTNPNFLMKDPEVNRLRLKAMAEIAEKYAHHKSFFGWYYPNETEIKGHYEDFFIDYVNNSSAEVSRLTPWAKTLIAPYGTRNIKADDQYIRQLEQLNVDFIAYQDEVGVRKTQIEESAGYFESLHKLHKKAAKSRLWADVEVFCYEGQSYRSAALAAPAERVIRQLEAVSPFVEKIFIFQYIGMINKPGTNVIAGHPDSIQLYKDLMQSGYLTEKK